ncbi:MAG: DUF1330 domain-containing protein [Steroidobacteraceae bacterium]
MAYYVIFDVTIHDLPTYQRYMAQVKPMIEAAGGRYRVRGGEHTVLEGRWFPTRLVLFEFPSKAAFQAFYDSAEYRALKPLRDASSTGDMVGVEGVPL